MDTSTLLTRYQSGKRDFSWASLPQADLSGANLANINLYRATLTEANLAGANLSNANLFKANLSGANLMGADLTGANLRKADLRGAQCEAETLRGADWHGALLPESLAKTLIQAAADPVAESPALDTNGLSPDLDESGLNGTDQMSASSPSNASNRWAKAVPLTPKVLPPHSRSDPIAQRELAISMAHLGLGLWCFGYILGAFQSFWPAGLLVWMSLLLGLWKEDLAWYVPIAGSTAVLLGTGVSLGALIFSGVATLMLLGSFSVYGNILGWRFAKVLGTTLWFGGLVFMLIHAAPWLFDGSNAYGGGGIVINLAQFQVALLLIIGTIALGRGALGYLQLNEGSYTKAHQWIYVGSSGALGLVLGVALG